MSDLDRTGKGLKKPILAIIGAAAIIATLLGAHLGTSLSVDVDCTTVEIPFVGVDLSVFVKNSDLLAQTGNVTCKVSTADGTYRSIRTVTLESGESTTIPMAVIVIR